MIPMPNNLHHERDLGQWAQRGIVLACTRAQINAGNYTQGKPCHVLTYGRERCRVQYANGEDQAIATDRLVIHWPDLGFVNTALYVGHGPKVKLALWIERRQQRQYTRAFNTRCIKCDVLGGWYIGEKTGYAVGGQNCARRFLTDHAQHAFRPEYPESLAAAKERLADPMTGSVALSRTLAVIDAEPPLLAYSGHVVGQLEDDGVVWDKTQETYLLDGARREVSEWL